MGHNLAHVLGLPVRWPVRSCFFDATDRPATQGRFCRLLPAPRVCFIPLDGFRQPLCTGTLLCRTRLGGVYYCRPWGNGMLSWWRRLAELLFVWPRPGWALCLRLYICWALACGSWLCWRPIRWSGLDAAGTRSCVHGLACRNWPQRGMPRQRRQLTDRRLAAGLRRGRACRHQRRRQRWVAPPRRAVCVTATSHVASDGAEGQHRRTLA